ncbi:MAG: hypothetical protein OEY30_00220 [Candidatus Bathyarchaeota archaeon]|nr:hypothetical protein [Candidatus Bathyarchaeota archaeon]
MAKRSVQRAQEGNVMKKILVLTMNGDSEGLEEMTELVQTLLERNSTKERFNHPKLRSFKLESVKPEVTAQVSELLDRLMNLEEYQ